MTKAKMHSAHAGMTNLAKCAIAAGLLMGFTMGAAFSQDMDAPTSTLSPSPSASSDNAQDQTDGVSSQSHTADQAGDNLADRDIMQKIRKAVVDDSSLSTSAHNVKIISKNGRVFLKGRVRSDEEKQSIGAKAVDVVGADKVVNHLSVMKQ